MSAMILKHAQNSNAASSHSYLIIRAILCWKFKSSEVGYLSSLDICVSTVLMMTWAWPWYSTLLSLQEHQPARGSRSSKQNSKDGNIGDSDIAGMLTNFSKALGKSQSVLSGH